MESHDELTAHQRDRARFTLAVRAKGSGVYASPDLLHKAKQFARTPEGRSLRRQHRLRATSLTPLREASAAPPPTPLVAIGTSREFRPRSTRRGTARGDPDDEPEPPSLRGAAVAAERLQRHLERRKRGLVRAAVTYRKVERKPAA